MAKAKAADVAAEKAAKTPAQLKAIYESHNLSDSTDAGGQIKTVAPGNDGCECADCEAFLEL